MVYEDADAVAYSRCRLSWSWVRCKCRGQIEDGAPHRLPWVAVWDEMVSPYKEIFVFVTFK